MNLKKNQRKPKANKSTPIVDQVIRDLLVRKELGVSRYGTFLQAFNKRNAARDMLEEHLDFILYTKQLCNEWNSLRADLKEIYKETKNAKAKRLIRKYL